MRSCALYLLAGLVLAGCDADAKFIPLGSGFFWTNKESSASHAPNTLLVVKVGDRFEDIADRIAKVEFVLVRDSSYVAYYAMKSGSRPEGLYVFKKGQGAKIIVEGSIHKLERTPDGITFVGFKSDIPTSLSWTDMERRFE